MNKLFLIAIVSLALQVTAHSQTKGLISTKIKTPNALCESCKNRIETYLKRYDGITFINVNYRKGETQVKYLTDRINIEEIKTAIANAGYDADDIPATEDAYARLPRTCKKFEDGGGHPKPKVVPPVQPPSQ